MNMFSRILAVIVLMVSVTLTEAVAAETSLPSRESFYAAREAFDRGDYGPLQVYWSQTLAYYEDAMRDRFDPETFAADRKAKGHHVDNEVIQRAPEQSRDMSETWFKRPAAETAKSLGDLSYFRREYAQAARYYRRAAQLQPQNPEYQTKLQEAIQSAANAHQRIN